MPTTAVSMLMSSATREISTQLKHTQCYEKKGEIQKSNKSEVRSIKVGWVAPEGVDDLEEV
jgi:hypothetical protein